MHSSAIDQLQWHRNATSEVLHLMEELEIPETTKKSTLTVQQIERNRVFP